MGSSVWHCLCVPVALLLSPTPWLKCVHVSVHVFVSTWLSMSAPPTMHNYMDTWVSLCGTVCLLQSSHFCFYTLFRMCTCISTCIYLHPTPHVSSTPYRWLHVNLCSCMWHCVCVPVTLLLVTHLVKICTCISTWIHVHLTAHVCSTPYAFLMDTWVPLCASVFQSQSHHFWSHTLFRMCTCISTCIYLHPTPHVSSTPYRWLHVNLCSCMWHCVCVPVTLLLITHLVKMCTCISTWIHVHLTAHVCSTPYAFLMETWVPLCASVFVSHSHQFCSNTLFRMCTCISTCIYLHPTPHVSSTPYG